MIDNNSGGSSLNLNRLESELALPYHKSMTIGDGSSPRAMNADWFNAVNKKRTATPSHEFHRNELYRFLVAKLPNEFRRGEWIDTLKLSQSVRMSRNWIYKSLHEDRLSLKLARRLIALSSATLDLNRKEALTLGNIAQFLIRN